MNTVRFAALAFIGGTLAAISAMPVTTALNPAPIARAVQSTVENTVDDGRLENIRKDAAQKQAEIQQRIKDKRAAVQQKLQGDRAQACQQREAHINEVLSSRVDAAQRHYDTFKSIQDRLEAFVVEKQLNVANASALNTIMDDRQASVLAAIEATRAATFSCAETDASAPGKIVMEQLAAEKQALKDYRTAIKDYAQAVKEAAEADSGDTQ